MDIVVKNAERKEKRAFNKVFGNDILKYLTEIITNSDDSYSRMEAAGLIEPDTVCPIYVHVNNSRGSREVYVVDNAEGMNDLDIKKNFEVYGDDTSGGGAGKKVRGLFGQGASDVLFNASLHEKRAEIYAFKDDAYYTCKFRWDENGDKTFHPVSPKLSKSQLRQVRSQYNIPHNGTVVRFGLPDQVGVVRNLGEAISSFYMLRFVLSKPNRDVVLIEHTAASKKRTPLKYTFPVKDASTELLKKPFSFEFDGETVHGLLELERLVDKTDASMRVLVYDEDNSVYDNTLFGYETYPGADGLHGYLKLEGSSAIIREKLNQDRPEEILTDSRDGMDHRHSFYKTLKDIVEPDIQKVLEALSKERGEKSVELSNQKEWKDAFKEINKYFEEELEEEIGGVDAGVQPPSDGLRFGSAGAKLTAGKKYGLKLLINTTLIPTGSQITIESSSADLEVSTENITITDSDVEAGPLLVKSVSVVGYEVGSTTELRAVFDQYSTNAYLEVVDKEVHYPKYGLEFWPKSVQLKTEASSSAKLFVDTGKFPLGTFISFESELNLVELDSFEVILSSEHLVIDDIARIDLNIRTGNDVGRDAVVAVVGGSRTTLAVNIGDVQTPPDPGSGGFLAGVKIKPDQQFWQTFFDRRDGHININSENNVNKLHLGTAKLDNFKPDKAQRRYIAELCANEAAKQLVRRKIEKGKIQSENYELVLDEIQKEKNKMLGIFIKSLDSFLV